MSVESSVLPTVHSFAQQEPKQTSKLILRSALQKANIAVQCDSTNDVMGAVRAYKEAIELLDKVLELVDKENDRKRLQEIHDSYSERIRLLATEIDEDDEDEDDEDEDDEDDWLMNHTLQKATVRKITSFEFKSNEINTPFVMQASKSNTHPREEKLKESEPKPTDCKQEDQSMSCEQEEFDLCKKIEKKKVPSLTLPSLKKEEDSAQSIKSRTSSELKIPRSSSISTIETLSDDHQPKHQQPTRLLGSIRKKAGNRLSVEGLVGRKSTTYVHSNGSPSFGHFIKDQTKDTEDVKEHQNLELILALEKSMQQGAYITKNLYIPKSLWQQTNVKLSYVDFKVSACTIIISDVSRLESWASLDNLDSSLKLLDPIEASVEKLKKNLSKKLKGESSKKISDNSSQTSNDSQTPQLINTKTEGSRKASHSFISWGSKLSKSVERINAFGLSKGEDNYKQYVEILEKLFYKVHILENWLNYYNEERKKSSNNQYDTIITRINTVCNGIDTVVGGFVIRDVTILLAKWLKRGSSWVNE